jgi:hypothetical protein
MSPAFKVRDVRLAPAPSIASTVLSKPSCRSGTQEPPYSSLAGTQYTDLKLLYEKENSCFEADDKIHMQNVMLFDDFMTTMDFNFTRRLCHYWNAKTSGVWPK